MTILNNFKNNYQIGKVNIMKENNSGEKDLPIKLNWWNNSKDKQIELNNNKLLQSIISIKRKINNKMLIKSIKN